MEGEQRPLPVRMKPTYGNRNRKPVCLAVEEHGAAWYSMEIHENCNYNDPFELLRAFVNYLKKLREEQGEEAMVKRLRFL